MKRGGVDLEKLRVALRRMSRGNLLMVAERAIEIVPRAKLGALVDMVRLDQLAEGKRGAAPLLDEVRKVHDASLRGEYYDSFDVNSKNFMDKSEGTEAFIAEFHRLIGKCVRTAARGPHAPVREAFELLFALLRRIDEDPDSVVFFADEAGSWQVGRLARRAPGLLRLPRRWHAGRGLRSRGRPRDLGLRRLRATSPPRRCPARGQRRAEGRASATARPRGTPVIRITSAVSVPTCPGSSEDR
jgi:hypothetical protein